jgi:hypothetical protein
VATPAFARRLGVVVSTTALAVVALGGTALASPAAASPNPASGTPNVHATDAPGQSNAHNPHDQQDQQAADGGAGSHVTDGTAGTSGDPTTAQPLSTADQNTGGANGQCPSGPYCSTRDGSPSGNGNGNGKAVGKPCAGCVGKADNKNPKGQMPNGSDHNAGYECDRNHGIGRTNPAHTGCKSGSTTVTSGSTDTTCPSGESMTNGACVLGTSYSRNPSADTVAGTAADVPASVLGERVVRTPQVSAMATSLPFTGAPTGELLLLAAAALTAGGALALAGRRRKVA